jgi:heme-degrading monooxygenase HmoA
MMHMRITRVRRPAENLEASISLYQQRLLPTIREQPGFNGVVLLSDRESGAGAATSTWESEEALNAAEQVIEEQRARNAEEMGKLGIEIVDNERYELTVLERVQPPVPGVCVRLISGQGSPGTSADAQRDLVRDRALPRVRGMKGFRAVLSGVNRENGRFFVISAWDTAADREASEAALAPLREELQQAMQAQSLQVERLEVAFAEVRASASIGT